MSHTPVQRLEAALRSPRRKTLAVLPHLTAGYPRRAAFGELLTIAASDADALVVGVPFSDPTADGLSLPERDRAALDDGATLRWALSALGHAEPAVPVVLASYVNPLLAYGLHRLVHDLAEVGVAAVIVLDLPSEESDELRRLCAPVGLGVVPTVAPTTPTDRVRRLCHDAVGFVHAAVELRAEGRSRDWLATARDLSPVPVCASVTADPSTLESWAGHVDGVILRGATPAL